MCGRKLPKRNASDWPQPEQEPRASHITVISHRNPSIRSIYTYNEGCPPGGEGETRREGGKMGQLVGKGKAIEPTRVI